MIKYMGIWLHLQMIEQNNQVCLLSKFCHKLWGGAKDTFAPHEFAGGQLPLCPHPNPPPLESLPTPRIPTATGKTPIGTGEGVTDDLANMPCNLVII